MDLQWAITAIILLSALIYVVFKIYKYFFSKPKRKSTACDHFSGDCAECIKHFSSNNKQKPCWFIYSHHFWMCSFFGIQLRIKVKVKVEIKICVGDESVGVFPCHSEWVSPRESAVATMREWHFYSLFFDESGLFLCDCAWFLFETRFAKAKVKSYGWDAPGGASLRWSFLGVYTAPGGAV